MTPDTIHPTSEELFAYRDGELSADKRALLEAHVTSCRACRERIDRVSALEAAMRQRPDPVEGDYYAALSRAVLRKIGAKEAGSGEAAEGSEARGPAAVSAPADRDEAPLRERRRGRDAEDPRLSRAPGIPWAALISTMAAASAVLVVVVLLVRQGGLRNQMLAQGPRTAAPTVGSPAESSASGPSQARESKAASPEAGPAPSAEATRESTPPTPKKQIALETGGEAAPGGAVGQTGPMAASRPTNEPLPAERLSEGAARKDEDRARAPATTESRVPAKAAAPSLQSLPIGGGVSPVSAYDALVRRFGLPEVWTEGSVPPDALLRAEPALRNLYISGRAGTDSARVRLYLAEAGRLRYESAPDSNLFDSVVHHYWRAIRLAGDDPQTARVARERLESFSR